MHLDFKIKVDKIDSQQFVGLSIPQIDWLLNEAQEIFIKTRIGINNLYQKGFEESQKRIEDLRPLVVKNNAIVLQTLDTTSYYAELPANYLYYLRATVEGQKNKCTGELKIIIQQHDDLNNVLTSAFYSPNFEWREVPAVFSGNTLVVYRKSDFTLSTLKLEYLKKPTRIQYPTGFENGEYELPDGTIVNIDQNSDFSDNMFAAREIVDIAVALATGNLGDSRYSIFETKKKINE